MLKKIIEESRENTISKYRYSGPRGQPHWLTAHASERCNIQETSMTSTEVRYKLGLINQMKAGKRR